MNLDDAMAQRAQVQASAIQRARSAFDALMLDDAAQSMRALLIGVLVAEELRCRALGVPPPPWDETLDRHGIASRITVDAMRSNFSQEATN